MFGGYTLMIHPHDAHTRCILEARTAVRGYHEIPDGVPAGGGGSRAHSRHTSGPCYAQPEPWTTSWTAWRFANLGTAIEARVREITGDNIPVDVRAYNEAPLHAQFRALTGRILVIRDSDAFARVVEYVVPRHLDAEPLRRSALRDLVSPRVRGHGLPLGLPDH